MTSTNLIRTRWAAIGAAVAVTLGAVGIGGLNIVSADVSSGSRPVYVPLEPCRLVDTRAAGAVGPRKAPVGPTETLVVVAAGANGECTGASAIPADAVALETNVTAVGATAGTYLTFWGDGANPGTSNLNPRPGSPPTPNSVTTPLSTAGTFNVYNNAGSVNVIVDVVGYYVGHDHDDRYERSAASLGAIEVNPLGFETNGGWTIDLALNHGGGTDDCATTAIDLPAGSVIEDMTISYFRESGDVRLRVFTYGITATSGTFASDAEIVEFFIEDEQTLPASGTNTIAEGTFDSTTADPIRPRTSGFIGVCTADNIIITGISIGLGG